MRPQILSVPLVLLLMQTSCCQPEPTPDRTVQSGKSRTAQAEPGVAPARKPVVGPTNPRNAIEPPASSRPQSPISVNVIGPANVPLKGPVDLRVQIDRASTQMNPVLVRVRLPAGVHLSKGKMEESIRDTAHPRLTRAYTITYQQRPKDDLFIVVDWMAAGAGFHAEVPWRFGRTAPKAAEPERLPGAIRLPGGKSIGTPILSPSGGKSR